MAKTAERSGSDQPSPKDVGRHLRQVRKQQGLSRGVVARSAGLTRRELAAYERGRAEVPESDLWCLAGSCGVEVSELLPQRDSLQISPDLATIGVGDTIRRLREPAQPDGLLREYLAMIYELRSLPPGSRVPLREPDLAALATALGGTPDAIEQKLIELIGASPDEAARIRAMILQPRSLASPAPTPADPYAALHTDEVPPAVEQFFASPGPTDPFATPDAGAAPADPNAVNPDAFWPGSAPTAPPTAPPPATGPTADPFAAPAPFSPEPAPVIPEVLRPPAPPPPAPAEPMPTAAQWPAPEPVAGAPSNPFEGPVDPQAAAAATLRDPFAPPPAEDPLVPPPLPPDPFGVPPAAGQSSPGAAIEPPPAAPAPPEPPSGNGHGVVVDDPFADSGPAEPIPEPIDLGVQVLDAIVVDDPMSAPSPAPPATELAAPEPTEVRGDDVDVLTPGRPDETRPIIGPANPITWNAGTGAPAAPVPAPPAAAPEPLAAAPVPEPPAATPVDTTPRFERASARWQIGGIFPATAMADDGTLALRRADARWALTDLTAPGDCILEAAFDFRAGSGFGVIFRGSIDEGERITGYSFDVDPIAGGGGYLVRLWEGNRQHWRPVAQAPVTDPALLYGRHVVRITLRADQLTVVVDGDQVLDVPALSRATVELGREPCRGDRVGVQAWSTTEVTVESFRVANL